MRSPKIASMHHISLRVNRTARVAYYKKILPGRDGRVLSQHGNKGLLLRPRVILCARNNQVTLR